MDQRGVRHRFRWIAVGLLACFSLLEFSARGPVRALGSSGRDFNDFISPYVQTRAWVRGLDPYAPSILDQMWPVSPRPSFLLSESADGTLAAKRGIPSPYLVFTFPLLLPVAELPWRVAICVWVGLCLLAAFSVAWTLIEFAGGRGRSELALLISVSVLLMAPMHTAIATSNVVTIVLALGLFASFCVEHKRSGLAGILLTVAMGLKATVGLPFVIYALASGKRGKVIPVVIVAGMLLLSATMLPEHGRTLWWKSFEKNSRTMFAPGAIDDFSTANPLAFQMVNLQAALFPVLQDRNRTQIVTWLVFIILLALWFRAVRRDREVGLLDLAILVTAALLPVYHRFTDAGLLLVPVAWALSEIRGELRRFAAGCLVLASPFLIPGATVLHEFSAKYEILRQLSQTRLWGAFILPHEAWLTLILCVLLLTARSLPRNQAGRGPGHLHSRAENT